MSERRGFNELISELTSLADYYGADTPLTIKKPISVVKRAEKSASYGD